MNIIRKTMAFFDMKKKKQRRKCLKLQKIIEKLSAKSKGLKKRYKKATEKEKKTRLLKEYKVVRKLLKKSRKRQSVLDETEKKRVRKATAA